MATEAVIASSALVVEEELTLTVKWSGKEYTVQICCDDTVGELKHRICEVTNALPKRQKLLYPKVGSKLFDDSFILSKVPFKSSLKMTMVWYALFSTTGLISFTCILPKAPAELRIMWEEVPCFSNLKYFKLTDWCNRGYIHGLAELFQRLPCIETLVLEKAQDHCRSTNTDGKWGEQLLFHYCRFNKLKSIEIQGIECFENELKFVEFLLKNSPVLEKMTIAWIVLFKIYQH